MLTKNPARGGVDIMTVVIATPNCNTSMPRNKFQPMEGKNYFLFCHMLSGGTCDAVFNAAKLEYFY